MINGCPISNTNYQYWKVECWSIGNTEFNLMVLMWDDDVIFCFPHKAIDVLGGCSQKQYLFISAIFKKFQTEYIMPTLYNWIYA